MTLRYPAHRINSIEKYVAESITSAAAAAIIPLTDRTLVRLAFSGAGVIDLEAGTEDGLYRILIAESVAGTTQLINSATVSLNSSWQPAAAGEVLEVMWNATISRWCEVARSAVSGGGGGGTYGTLNVTFTRSVHSITATVLDAGVAALSNIVVSIGVPSTRDIDEMELAPVVAAVGTIVPGVSFDVIAVSIDGDADGIYNLNYTRD